MQLSLKVVSAVVLSMFVASVASAQLAPKALSEFRNKMKAGYGSISVTQRGKQLQISLDVPKVSQDAYVTALSIACVHLGANAKQVAEIAVLNKFSAHGFVYETPGQCQSVANSPIQKAQNIILGATRSY